MEHTLYNLPSTSLTIPIIYHDDLRRGEEKIKKYEPLLHSIAKSFGYSDRESWELVQQVCLQAHKSFINGQIYYPIKVRLAKDLVHQCVFKLSSQLFSQQNRDEENIKSSALKDYSAYISPGGAHLQTMPLSYRTVYILIHIYKFNDVDVAEMLNITPLKVKERLKKAMIFFKDHL